MCSRVATEVWLVRMNKTLWKSEKAGQWRVGEGDELEAEGRRRHPEGNVPIRRLCVSMAAGAAVGVNTAIVMSWATLSDVPWYPHPFQCRPNPRECPLTSTLTL